MKRCSHFIDGRSQPPASASWLDVHDPSTGRPYAQVARGDAADVDAAVADQLHPREHDRQQQGRQQPQQDAGQRTLLGRTVGRLYRHAGPDPALTF